MTFRSVGLLSSPVSGVLGLEDLRVFVVDHRLGDIDLLREEQRHVDRLDDRGVVGPLGQPGLLGRGGHLELIAEVPDPDLLALEVGRRRDVRVLPRHRQRAGALEDLGDVDEVGGRGPLASLEHLRDPADGEFGAIRGRPDGLRDDIGATVEDRDLEAGCLVVALLLRGEVARELGLRRPLELEPDLVESVALAPALAERHSRLGAAAEAALLGALDAPPPLHAANAKLAVAASARNLRV